MLIYHPRGLFFAFSLGSKSSPRARRSKLLGKQALVIDMLASLKTILAGGEQDYAELVEEGEAATKLQIVVDRVESFTDSDRVIRNLREGKVTFAKIGTFKDTNIDELRRTVAKIKTVCRALDGDIVAVANEWLIVSPPQAQITK